MEKAGKVEIIIQNIYQKIINFIQKIFIMGKKFIHHFGIFSNINIKHKTVVKIVII